LECPPGDPTIMSPVKRIIPEIWARLRMTMGTLVSRKHQYPASFFAYHKCRHCRKHKDKINCRPKTGKN